MSRRTWTENSYSPIPPLKKYIQIECEKTWKLAILKILLNRAKKIGEIGGDIGKGQEELGDLRKSKKGMKRDSPPIKQGQIFLEIYCFSKSKFNLLNHIRSDN